LILILDTIDFLKLDVIIPKWLNLKSLFMSAHKLTKQKIQELKEELQYLETEKSPNLSDELKKQRNEIQDEFDSNLTELLEEKDQIQKRIIEIQIIIDNCEEIDENAKAKIVEIGTKVKVEIDGNLLEYRIVEAIEANPMDNKISADSPIGKALIGKMAGDVFLAKIGSSDKEFKIEDISYK